MHNSEDFFGKRYNQKSIKYGLVGALGSKSIYVKQYNKSKYKQKKELKALRKQNKTLYSIAKNPGSLRELKKINNIRAKYFKKHGNSSSESSRD